jgi:hypothetical protein
LVNISLGCHPYSKLRKNEQTSVSAGLTTSNTKSRFLESVDSICKTVIQVLLCKEDVGYVTGVRQAKRKQLGIRRTKLNTGPFIFVGIVKSYYSATDMLPLLESGRKRATRKSYSDM